MATPESLQTLRPLMFSIAYRMLGSVSEADDMVQEALLRHHRAVSEGVSIRSAKAFLSTIVTRLCVDHLRSARARRETYVGQWLPEPLLTDEGAGADAKAEQADALSLAFLVLLERLSPVERAVFLLHDVFGYDYDEIAEIVGKSADNCRQLALRARRHIEAGKPRFEPSADKRQELAVRFFDALRAGDEDALVKMLATDAIVYGDGGGVGPSWRQPITGVDRVSRLIAGLGRQMGALGLVLEPREVNGQPGALVLDGEHQLVNVFVLDVADGAVRSVRSVINPDKLKHLGPLADVRELIRRYGKMI
jgi:RNA polymerase sigma-70 factor (ECF subfamily)